MYCLLQWPGGQLNCVGWDQMAGMGGVMVGKWDKTGIKILLGGAGEIILLGEEILHCYAGWDKHGF